MSTNDKPNLARIRENQRRSRARRKEYLQELEGRWRRCEQAGAEASSEIQVAARKVADENKRLRLLLRERGVQEHELNDYLVRTGGGPQALTVAPLLDTLLSHRKDCGNVGGCDGVDPDQKPTSWRPVWTEVPIQPLQPPPLPPSSLTEAQPHFQPAPCSPTDLGCCAVESVQSRTDSVFGHEYPQLREFARAGYHIPGANSHAMSYPATTGQPTSLIANAVIPHLAYDMAPMTATPLASNLACAPGNDCKVQNGLAFPLADQHTNHSLRL
ncbi:MAG: hypothetical protein M1816_007703 [Peltula sp. TS41687]|nr:MAG: hypothetical protein M1816_007703 [Peltula sp. TS41687]